MPERPEYLDKMARFACGLRVAELEPETRLAARDVVADTLGAIVAGSRIPENRKLAALAVKMSGSATSTIIGHRKAAGPLMASLANSASGVALEMDEGNRLGGGHPAIHVIPAALAVAEEQQASGSEFLAAVIAAYEVTSRVGAGTDVRAEVHSHGTWGTIGSAVATARLMALGERETREAINIAASMSPANTWTPCIEGATVRNLYPGRSAMQGIMAANLVECGFTGLHDGPGDVYGEILGGGFDGASAVAGLENGGPLRIQQNYFKLHACCLYNHPAIDGMNYILQRGGFGAGDVESINVLAPPIASIMNDPAPANMLAAKFSLPFALASAVTRGSTDGTAFCSDRLKDEETLSLARRVTVASDPEMNLRRYEYPAAFVTVSLNDGRVLSESVIAHHGDHRNPASAEELAAKFAFLTRDSLGDSGVQAVLDAVAGLEQMGDIRELTGLLRG